MHVYEDKKLNELGAYLSMLPTQNFSMYTADIVLRIGTPNGYSGRPTDIELGVFELSNKTNVHTFIPNGKNDGLIDPALRLLCEEYHCIYDIYRLDGQWMLHVLDAETMKTRVEEMSKDNDMTAASTSIGINAIVSQKSQPKVEPAKSGDFGKEHITQMRNALASFTTDIMLVDPDALSLMEFNRYLQRTTGVMEALRLLEDTRSNIEHGKDRGVSS